MTDHILGKIMGVIYGRHRRTIAEASDSSAETSYRTDVGTGPRAFSYRDSCYKTIEDAGIRAGEIIAYRAWMLGDGGLLWSIFAPYVWKPQAIEKASDLKFYGLHAFKTLGQAKRHYHCYSIVGTVVFGSVSLWGEVIEHERGYRAEYAAIQSLDAARLGVLSPCGMFRAWRQLRELRKLYKV